MSWLTSMHWLKAFFGFQKQGMTRRPVDNRCQQTFHCGVCLTASWQGTRQQPVDVASGIIMVHTLAPQIRKCSCLSLSQLWSWTLPQMLLQIVKRGCSAFRPRLQVIIIKVDLTGTTSQSKLQHVLTGSCTACTSILQLKQFVLYCWY